MGAVWAVLGAIVVFVLTQSFLKLVLEPIQEQRKLIGEIASALVVYEKSLILRVYSESTGEYAFFGATREEAAEAHRALRELAGRLRASVWSIPAYDVFALFRVVPKVADVAAAAEELRMWYSQLPGPINNDQAARIKESQDTISKRLGIEERLKVIKISGASGGGGGASASLEVGRPEQEPSEGG